MTEAAATSRPTLIVLGATGTIGREVCRLAVAYGCDVLGVSRRGQAPNSEPWTHGVEWSSCDVQTELHTFLTGVAAAPVSIVDATPASTRGHARLVDVERVVEIGCADEPMLTTQLPANVIHLRTPRILADEEFLDRPPGSTGIANGHAAMAALRAAVEADHAGIMEPGRVALLGDAMFLQ